MSVNILNIKKLKGNKKCSNLFLLSSLAYVDYVFLFKSGINII